MSERRRQVAVAAGIGIADGLLELNATTLWVHRSLTHNSYQPKPWQKLAARTVIWGTGIKPRVWAAVHRDHHDFADQAGDPHSPVQQGKFGVLKVLVKNPFLYRDHAEAKTDDQLPADLKPDELDKKIFDHSGVGMMANFAGHIAANKAVGNPGYMAGISFITSKLFYLAGGNFVNSIGHAGQHPWRALATGEITPNEDGSFGADSLTVGAFTYGEGNQRYHHDHPGEYFFYEKEGLSSVEMAVRDTGGTIIHIALQRGWVDPSEQKAA